ncbi:MAG: hypothetical protein GX843_06960 [Synergistaceae bacterium]|nr:hypothetical protein [Synergistaceae bacterium]
MRQIVLVLSMGTIVLYGYALAGMGGYLMGRGRADYIVLGLGVGSILAASAIFLWKKYLLTLGAEAETGGEGRKDGNSRV